MANIWDILTQCAGRWGGGGVGLQTSKRLDGFWSFRIFRKFSVLILLLFSIVSDLHQSLFYFCLPRLLHIPIRESIIMFYLHLPLSLFSIIKYVIYRRSQRHIEGRANSSRSGYIYTISLQNMFTLKPWTSIQNKQYYTGKILTEYEI